MCFSLLKGILCLAVMALGGSVPLWGQELPADEAAVQVDPSLVVRFEGEPWVGPAPLVPPEPAAPPDAPSALREEEMAGADSSSSRPPAPQPDYGGGGAPVVKPAASVPPSQKFRWGPALRQSLLFLGVEHGFRMTQLYTRKRLAGPFFQDWFDSITEVSGWNDNDAFSANYIGHPMQGAAAGYIQVQNDPKGIHQEFGGSPEYWKSRMRALAWSAAYSVQFELGPISEASIGNVGQKRGTGGAVDLVVTPVAGLGWMVTEDALDKYVIQRVEQKSQSRNLRALTRSLLNPSRSFANLLRRKPPWHRDTRDGVTVAGRFPRPPAPRPAAVTPPSQPAADPRPAAAAAPPSPPPADPAQSCETPCP